MNTDYLEPRLRTDILRGDIPENCTHIMKVSYHTGFQHFAVHEDTVDEYFEIINKLSVVKKIQIIPIEKFY